MTMCRIAAAELPACEVSDIELRRSGPSYTIDTVQQLLNAGQKRVCWLIGADMLAIFPKWHRARDLMELATILVIARPGVKLDFSVLPPEFQRLKANVVEAPLVDISATEIRRRVAAGLPIDDLTPPGVAHYIEEHGLYRGKSESPIPDEDQSPKPE